MNVMKFGVFLLLVGLVAAGGAFFVQQITKWPHPPKSERELDEIALWVRLNNPSALEDSEFVRRAADDRAEAKLFRERNELAEKFLWGGGLAAVLGFGIMIAAKKPEERA